MESLKEKIGKILEDSKGTDWGYNGEDEVQYDTFDDFGATEKLTALFNSEFEELLSSHSELFRRLSQMTNGYGSQGMMTKAVDKARQLNEKYSNISDNDKLTQS